MSAATGRPEPVTPRKNRLDPSAVDSLISQLNHEYNLAIKQDKTLTPRHRRERSLADSGFARNEQICQGIHFLYYRYGKILDDILGEFRSLSKAASIQWVRKPRADRDTLPRSSGVCRAVTPDETVQLQKLLLSLISQKKATLLRSPSTSTATNTITATVTATTAPSPSPAPKIFSKQPHPPPDLSAPGTPTSNRHAPFPDPSSSPRRKRHSPDPPDASPSKRPRSRHGSRPLDDAIDDIPARQRSVGRPVYDRSANTSKTSLGGASVFSQGVDPPRSTQTSTNASQEDIELPILALPSQDSFPASSSVARVLDDSLSLFRRQGSDRHQERELEPAPETRAPEPPVPKIRAPEPPVPETRAPEPPTPDPVLAPADVDRSKVSESPLAITWPSLPPWLATAPFPVVWEITRAAVHCGVDLDSITLPLPPSWEAYRSVDAVRKILYRHEAFQGKAFPEKPSAAAWKATWDGFKARDMIVQFSMTVDPKPGRTASSFVVQLKPPRLEKGCRLNRHFGPDRFVEVLIPSPGAWNSPVKDAPAFIRSLTRSKHAIVGRQWAAFFTCDAGYRAPVKEFRISPDAKPVFKDRIQLFAECSIAPSPRPLPNIAVHDMLDWLLNFDHNQSQSYLKLFSRIQLGLSKTLPVLELQPHQIHHRPHDILSPDSGAVMNDGIGRMSLSVARKVRDVIGLSDIPCAVQARIGSAKGMWLIDVTDDGTQDWIETYPSQRKWECDQSDPHQRCLEVHSVPAELKSASLNLQFLPVLENRARDRRLMREVIGDRLVQELNSELREQKTSMERPLLYSTWLNRTSSTRPQRVAQGQVPFLGGLPERDEEVIMFLLHGGFHPMKLYFLKELTFRLQLQQCKTLKTKLNIRIKQSAYMFMVVDFLGVLDEGEVHVGFSTKFQGDDSSGTLLHGVDLLVARSPAHFVSDVQKVRAVFRPELQALKDVIIFSTKGRVPLADKLSGGDYDGDKAWVCWDSDIVDNFVNAEVPEPPDLSDFLKKDRTTLGDLLTSRPPAGSRPLEAAVAEMLERSFEFNMRPSLLGICTNYKERLCYKRGRVDDEASVILSKLLSDLVDQPKQGINFGQDDWNRLRVQVLGEKQHPPDPGYKKEFWQGGGDPTHIIDHLKFLVAKPTIDRELTELSVVLDMGGTESLKGRRDEDLTRYYHYFNKNVAAKSQSSKDLLEVLKKSIDGVCDLWKMKPSETDFPEHVRQVYDAWCDIRPAFSVADAVAAKVSSSTPSAGVGVGVGATETNGRGSPAPRTIHSKVVAMLEEPYVAHSQVSRWALLRASVAFDLYCEKQPRFVWQMAGRELQFIKAMVSGGSGDARDGGVEGPPVPVTPLMYAALTVDKKFVRQFSATLDGGSSDYFGPDDSDAEEDDT